MNKQKLVITATFIFIYMNVLWSQSPKPSPSWWLVEFEKVEDYILEKINRGNVEILSVSAGKRNIYMISYGSPEPELRGTANLSSALGSRDPDAYYQKSKRKRPVMVVLAGVHGSEPEGIINAISLVNIMETGRDLQGIEQNELKSKLEQVRLVIIPLANPDGQVRYPYESNIGLTTAERRVYAQGTDKEGVPLSASQSKKVHPKPAHKLNILGAYFDDNGVNLMHDNFFSPMSTTTQALLNMADWEGADILLNLHSHGKHSEIYPTDYVPMSTKVELAEFASKVYNELNKNGYKTSREPKVEPDGGVGEIPPFFNINSAFYHSGISLPITFEFPDGNTKLQDEYEHSDLLKIGEILFDMSIEHILKKP